MAYKIFKVTFEYGKQPQRKHDWVEIVAASTCIALNIAKVLMPNKGYSDIEILECIEK